MSPLEFIQRLAALVPPPRLHLIRFHGALAPNTRLRPDIIPNVPVNANTPSADHAEVPPPLAPARMSWARLLKRVFEIDMEYCSQCGGTLEVIVAIEDPPVITKILTHLGLPARTTAPSSGQGLRSIPTGLIPHRSPDPHWFSP
jgi:putative transposase